MKALGLNLRGQELCKVMHLAVGASVGVLRGGRGEEELAGAED